MKKPTKKPVANIQTGKTLPHRISSYSPSHSQNARSATVQPNHNLDPKKRSVWKRVVFCLVLFIFSSVLLLGIWDAKNISSATKKMFGSGNIFNLLSTADLKGAERGRVNVLLIGYSIDDPGHPAAKLTDSLILLSMNTTTKTGYMLSIPRDLYVNISGNGYGKINEAYGDGGVGELEHIISANFKTPIDYYFLVNYASVKDTVDALGGINVNIQSKDPRGLYDPNISPVDGGPLKLANGPLNLDGQTALNFTRARGDAYDSYGFAQADFDRTQHQRQVLTAIKDKLNWKLVLNPRKNSQILNAVANNLKTDVSASEVRALFGLFNSIPSASLQSLSLRTLNGNNYLSSYTTVYGQSALVPSAGIDDYSQIVDALAAVNN
ncbi:LCP family protein [Candidatus Saccharibacteria bacterium]|nr:LCP family protein [Candidatus Saccharibacteria bacterium]